MHNTLTTTGSYNLKFKENIIYNIKIEYTSLLSKTFGVDIKLYSII